MGAGPRTGESPSNGSERFILVLTVYLRLVLARLRWDLTGKAS